MSKDEPLPALDRTLYVVATPIGNLRDITLRALDVLRQVDIVAAEDTRVTRLLAAHYGISATLVSLHEHNERRRAAEIISWLAAGKRVALVSDAGTPAVSDPGAELVRAVAQAGYGVVPVPGASALVAALSASGIRAPQWMFCGFLPASAAARAKALERVRAYPCALVFYEAPHRVADTVAALAAVLGGGRMLVVAREITKRFESIYRCRLEDAARWLAADANRRKGEFVLIVDVPEIAEDPDENASDATLAALLDELPLAQAVRIAVAITGVARNRLYRRALAIRNGLDDPRKGGAK